jgi:hypothetical protein
MAHYEPPKQGRISQFIDVILLMALTIGALLLPGYMGMSGAARNIVPVENPTWESLGQNAVMVERWNQLGFADAASAHDMITARFDYSFTWTSLAVMIVIIVGYFVMMLRLSDQEYRDVIAEKFGRK